MLLKEYVHLFCRDNMAAFQKVQVAVLYEAEPSGALLAQRLQQLG